MKKCEHNCVICPYIKGGKHVKSQHFTWKINTKVNCLTYNLIYMIECNIERCKQRYIGETERNLKTRISEHIGYINTRKMDKVTGEHFNMPGHSKANMTVTILEKVKSNDTFYIKEIEKYHIRKFNTLHCGLNLKS